MAELNTLLNGFTNVSADPPSNDYKHQEPEDESSDALFDGVYSSPEMIRASTIAKMVARTDVPVLITGESGVGKEIFARFIHKHSLRGDKPLIRVNCAALPNDLLESELFGYERGAFTGAVAEKPGKFELAHGGAILLDEIAEIKPHLQAKLLHVLQDGEYSRLGGKRPLQSDARILASTNRKLEKAVACGEFRDDLYFRLNVIQIRIPPLRERKEEILLLSNYFIRKYRDKYGSSVGELPAEMFQALLDYDWPGNVRELENVIRRCLILPQGHMDLAFMTQPLQHSFSSPRENFAPLTLPSDLPQAGSTQFASLRQVSELAAEQAERKAIMSTLQQTNWNRKQAALRLNVCYKALLNKIKKWQIERPVSEAGSSERRRENLSTTRSAPTYLRN
jgi:two-component system response regulator AtoC